MSEDRVTRCDTPGCCTTSASSGCRPRVLQKAGKLTDEEFAAIKLHPVHGREIISDIEFLDEAINGIYHHHERIDGRGYPVGLR